MVVVTAILIFLLLIFAPIPFVLSGRYILLDKFVQVQIDVFGLNLASESIFVGKQGIGYKGTVDGYFKYDDEEKQSGVDIANSICMHSILLFFRSNFANLDVRLFAFQHALLGIASAVFCSFCNCQFACLYDNFSFVDDFQFSVKASVSVAELSFCFIKQGVRKCKLKLQKL